MVNWCLRVTSPPDHKRSPADGKPKLSRQGSTAHQSRGIDQMDQSLNELFSVIIQSEKVALDEQRKYREAKENITQVQMRLERQNVAKKTSQENIEHLKERLVIVTSKMKLLAYKEDFHVEKLRMIQSEITSSTEKLETLRSSHERDSKSLMSLVKDFSLCYGLTSGGQVTRETEAGDVLKHLISEKESLSQELRDFQQRQNKLSDELTHKREILELTNGIQEERKNVETSVRTEEIELEKQQIQHAKLQVVPEMDEEFITLNANLQHYQTSELELEARRLHTELSELTRSLRQKEGQNLRDQYRQWQRCRQYNMLQLENKQPRPHQQESDSEVKISDTKIQTNMVTTNRLCISNLGISSMSPLEKQKNTSEGRKEEDVQISQ